MGLRTKRKLKSELIFQQMSPRLQKKKKMCQLHQLLNFVFIKISLHFKTTPRLNFLTLQEFPSLCDDCQA